jgi:hypothetical protein
MAALVRLEVKNLSTSSRRVKLKLGLRRRRHPIGHAMDQRIAPTEIGQLRRDRQ